MNFVKNFIQTQNITSIDQLEEILKKEQYNLKLKKFKNNELMIIVHEENTNLNEELCQHIHGVIIDPELNTIRYTSKKAYENEENKKEVCELIDKQNAIITPIIDGTFISVYKYQGKIYYSTKKALEARLSRWQNNKNFEQLFKEAVNDVNFESFIQENYTYNFILCSKENSNIVSYEESKVVLLNVIEFNNKTNIETEFFNELLLNPNIQYIENMKISNIEEFFNENDKEKLDYLGVYITDFNNSQKIYFDNYIKLKAILPNNHDINYTFLTLRKNKYMLEMYLNNNPNKKELFKNFETNICHFVTYIHKLYMTMRVKKEQIVIPEFIRTTLYKIHGIYLTTKNPITLNVIFNHLNILHEKQLYVLLKKYNTFLNQSNNSADVEMSESQELEHLNSMV
jgi:hypothetical protein